MFTPSPDAKNRTIADCIRYSWAIHLHCSEGHSARWNVGRLEEEFGGEVGLEEIAKRLKCRVCGSTSGSLSLRQDRVVTQAREIAAKEAEERGR